MIAGNHTPHFWCTDLHFSCQLRTQICGNINHASIGVPNQKESTERRMNVLPCICIDKHMCTLHSCTSISRQTSDSNPFYGIWADSSTQHASWNLSSSENKLPKHLMIIIDVVAMLYLLSHSHSSMKFSHFYPIKIGKSSLVEELSDLSLWHRFKRAHFFRFVITMLS